jgi:pimeloyl-ACP methyl ester carboxylesterase
MLTRATRVDRTVRLADGRVLGYAEYGSADGPPLFLFHGLPGSRLAAPEMWPGEPGTVQEPGRVRVIAPDRPGMGESSFQPGRRLTGWADDVRQLADSLEIQRFLAAGFSGGGPHALAVAHGLPERVIAVGSIAGAGMIGARDAREALRHANPTNRLIFALARRAPRLLWPLMAQHASAVRRQPGKVIDSAARDRRLPESDRQAMTDPGLRERMMAAASEAFRQGVRGAVHEAHICAKPWGFDPAAIQPPVYLWHGDQDTNVPVAMAQHLADRIPDNSLTIYPGEGHLIVPRHWDEILATLLSADPRAT